ncbi:MAG: lactonase family protein [Verrucomicrobiota bacterium]|jgi:6-phosphogluconolactonase
MKLLYHLRLAGLMLAGGLFCAPVTTTASASSDGPVSVYIGTYTAGAKSQGIYLARLDSATGRLGAPELAAKTANPSFLAAHPNRRFLYAVGETGNFRGTPAGLVSAFGIAADSGKLTLLNEQSSGGAGPCHLAVDRTGKWLLVANYGSGSIAVLPIQEDGALGEPGAIVQHHGSSVNPQRQEGPHAHFITPGPANRFVLTCDLGLDKVLVYRLDPVKGTLVPNDPPSASLRPGAGPRHLAFHPNGRLLFVISEMGSSLTAFSWDSRRGALKELETVSTLPAGFAGKSTCAEVQVHPSGKFLYGSNRGHDSIAVFAVDSRTGKLSLLEHQSTQGKTPRHFAIDPAGRWLLAENQDSDNIVVFRIDAQTGRLTPAGQEIKVGSPVCVEFVASPK